MRSRASARRPHDARSIVEKITGAEDDARSRLAALRRDELGHLEGVDTLLLGAPSAASSIAAYARDHGVDLVVVSSHGCTGLKRLLIGSVAERVVRLCPCSVLVARDVAAEATGST